MIKMSEKSLTQRFDDSMSLDNDDMESSKRCVKLFSLIFIIRSLIQSKICNANDLFPKEYEIISHRGSLCPKHAELGHFMLLFFRVQRFLTHVHSVFWRGSTFN